MKAQGAVPGGQLAVAAHAAAPRLVPGNAPRTTPSSDLVATSTPDVPREGTGLFVVALGRDRWLWAILVLALGLRLAMPLLAPAADLLGDEREYYSAAAILADGRGFSFFDEGLWVRPPLYSLLLVGFFRSFGPELQPAWLAQAVLSTATVALVYALARLCYGAGRRGVVVARLAAILCAIYLPFAVYTRFFLSETLFTFLLVGAFAALLAAERAREGDERAGRAALVVAGAGLGTAVLTRGLALPFLAVVPLWLLGSHWRGGEGARRSALRRGALVLLVAGVVVAPWTARNALAYGRFIPVETTGGYNFWLGAAGGRGAGQIVNELLAVPNQGDRQALAFARGWTLVRADPGVYVAKSLREGRDLWAINFGAAERLLAGFGRGKVAPHWLALTLLLDDLLYLAALPLAPFGWWRTRRTEQILIGSWLGYSTLAAALFFAITRFRIPLLPFVFLLAARGATELDWGRLRRGASLTPQPAAGALWTRASGSPSIWRGRGSRASERRGWVRPLAALLIVALVWPSFAPGLYRVGLRTVAEDARLERGYELLAAGRAGAALAEFERLPEAFYARPTALAAARRALEGDERALAILDEMRADERDFPNATLLRGDIHRAAGRDTLARRTFGAREVRVANPVEEAWARLAPGPGSRLDIGDGLDLGRVRGVAPGETERDGTTFRWTGPRAELRLVAPTHRGAVLRLRLKSYRPRGAPPPVRVSVDGQRVGTVTPTGEWDTYELPLVAPSPGAALSGTAVVRLDAETFVPGYAEQRARGCSPCRLGVMLDWVEIVPPSSGGGGG